MCSPRGVPRQAGVPKCPGAAAERLAWVALQSLERLLQGDWRGREAERLPPRGRTRKSWEGCHWPVLSGSCIEQFQMDQGRWAPPHAHDKITVWLRPVWHRAHRGSTLETDCCVVYSAQCGHLWGRATKPLRATWPAAGTGRLDHAKTFPTGTFFSLDVAIGVGRVRSIELMASGRRAGTGSPAPTSRGW